MIMIDGTIRVTSGYCSGSDGSHRRSEWRACRRCWSRSPGARTSQPPAAPPATPTRHDNARKTDLDPGSRSDRPRRNAHTRWTPQPAADKATIETYYYGHHSHRTAQSIQHTFWPIISTFNSWPAMAMNIQDAATKSNPLGEILYLHNCSRF